MPPTAADSWSPENPHETSTLPTVRKSAESATFWCPIPPSIHEMWCPQQTEDVLPAALVVKPKFRMRCSL
jgi:hypothetical protein